MGRRFAHGHSHWLDSVAHRGITRLDGALALGLSFASDYPVGSTTMTDRQIIVPDGKKLLCEHAGYAPGVKVGKTLYCAGQVGRTPELSVIEDPEQQFLAAWENLRLVLTAGGCEFDDVVEMTTYHIDMQRHMPIFRQVKDQVFPRSTAHGHA